MSILQSIRKLVCGSEEDTSFDSDLVMHINAAFMTLHQLGVGPTTCFRIKDDTETWDSFLGESSDLESVKDYVGLKVRLRFDPPTNTAVLNSLTNLSKEYEWRLNAQAEMDTSGNEEG